MKYTLVQSERKNGLFHGSFNLLNLINLLILLAILLLSFSCQVFADDPNTINFTQAVQLAYSFSPKLMSSSASVDAARANTIKARGNALPKLDLDENAARSNNPLNVFSYHLEQRQVTFNNFGFAQFSGAGSLNTAPTELNEPGYASNYDTGLMLNIPLYAGGRNIDLINKANSLLESAQQGNIIAQENLIYQLLESYEGFHATAQLEVAANQSLIAATTFLNIARSLYKQGVVIQSDVLLAQTNQRAAEATLADVIAQNENQLDTFRVLLGKPDSEFIPGANVNIYLPSQSINDLEKLALIHNPQILAYRANKDASREDMNAARAQNLPKINLVLEHDWYADTPTLSAPSNTAMLEMNWPLFSSGMQYGEYKQAAAEFSQSAANLDDTENNIRLAVDEAYRLAQTAEIQARYNDTNSIQAEEAMRLLVLRYQQGIIPITQLLQGQAQLDNVRAERVSAHYNVLMARAKLYMLINQLSPAICHYVNEGNSSISPYQNKDDLV